MFSIKTIKLRLIFFFKLHSLNIKHYLVNKHRKLNKYNFVRHRFYCRKSLLLKLKLIFLQVITLFNNTTTKWWCNKESFLVTKVTAGATNPQFPSSTTKCTTPDRTWSNLPVTITTKGVPAPQQCSAGLNTWCRLSMGPNQMSIAPQQLPNTITRC